MLVQNVRVQPYNSGQVTVSWEALDTEWLVWVYLNGQLIVEAMQFEADVTTRSVTIDWDPNETHVLEVHEVPEGITAKPIHCQLWIHPQISWNAVADADRYRIYWKAAGASTEYLIFEDTVTPDSYGICRVYSPLSGAGEEKAWWVFQTAALFANVDVTRQHHLSLSALDGRGGKWHAFRVVSVDKIGNESDCDSWMYWAAAPENAKTVTVSAGSSAGLYNLTITEQSNEYNFGHPDF